MIYQNHIGLQLQSNIGCVLLLGSEKQEGSASPVVTLEEEEDYEKIREREQKEKVLPQAYVLKPQSPGFQIDPSPSALEY